MTEKIVTLHTPFQVCELTFESAEKARAAFDLMADSAVDGRLFVDADSLTIFADGTEYLKQASDLIKSWKNSVDSMAEAGFLGYDYLPKREVVMRIKDKKGDARAAYSFVFRKEAHAYKAFLHFTQFDGVKAEGFGLDLVCESPDSVDRAFAELFDDLKESGFVDYAESAPADLKGAYLKHSPRLANTENVCGFALGGLDLTISDENPRVARLLNATEKASQSFERGIAEQAAMRKKLYGV